MKTSISTLSYVTLLISIAVTACSNEAVYQGAKQRNEMECRKLPNAEYEECMGALQKEFDTYQEERKEITGDRY